MNNDSPPEHPLQFHARRYADAPASANARSNYIVRLQVAIDATIVCAIARQFALTPAIALPAWLRAATMANDNESILLEAASALYSNGLDEPAMQYVDQALALNSNSIPALQLKAALTPDPLDRRKIFEDILKIEPGNRIAVDNLILLDRPR